jgi:hypothetical protein
MDRTILDPEAGPALHVMRGNSRCSKLWDDDLTVGDDAGKSGGFDAADQFIGAERAFSGSAPDIDPFGIQH